MARFWKLFAVGLLLAAGIWYFFIKSYDYKITFKTKQATGIVYNKLLRWNNWQIKDDIVKTELKVPYEEIVQELHFQDSIFDVHWEIYRKSDSLTVVEAHWRDRNNSLAQRFQIPFIMTDFAKRSLASVKRIQSELSELNNNYKVGKVEEATIPKHFCAYVSLESKIGEKANTMMANNFEILTFLQDNQIKLLGSPFLEVTNWNEKEATLSFDFCFPIGYDENYPVSDIIQYKATEEREALKTKFNGNYRISDCAWFTIIDYAESRNIEIEKLPTEIFMDDPHNGGNELDWEAEIYIPLKEVN